MQHIAHPASFANYARYHKNIRRPNTHLRHVYALINTQSSNYATFMFLEIPNYAQNSCSQDGRCNPSLHLAPLPRPQEILLTYNAVGIFEYWDLSMQLFDAKVKSPVEKWDASITHNPGVRNEAREELLVWASSSPELHSLLSADLHIYQFAIAIFKSQTRATLGTVWESRL